jgi:uncharacterized protein YjbI with pentapeptide repeats
MKKILFTALLALSFNANAGTFAGKDLQGINFRGVAFADGTSFKGANLNDADLSNVRCVKCNFTGAKMQRVLLDHGLFNRSHFRGADLSQAHAEYTHLNKANFTGANLRDSNWSFSNLINANLTGADLTGVYATYAKIYRPVIVGSIWDYANVTMSRLIGMKWSLAKSMKGIRTSNAFLGKK